jgi:hypothetical protein
MGSRELRLGTKHPLFKTGNSFEQGDWLSQASAVF